MMRAHIISAYATRNAHLAAAATFLISRGHYLILYCLASSRPALIHLEDTALHCEVARMLERNEMLEPSSSCTPPSSLSQTACHGSSANT